jgi:hypothetical protein
MISSTALRTWLQQQPSVNGSTWAGFIKSTTSSHLVARDNITNCLDKWHQIKNKQDIKAFAIDNPQVGYLIVEQSDELTIVHHLYFHENGRTYGFSTNSVADKPMEIVFSENIAKPITTTTLIKWSSHTANKTNRTKIDPNDTIGNTDNETNDQIISIDDNETVDEMTKPPPSKKRKTRTKKTLSANDDIFNGIIFLAPEVTAVILALPQPYDFESIRTKLEDFELDVTTELPLRDLSCIHQATGLIFTFTECAKYKNLIPRTFVNPIRNDNILRTILYHTVPPHKTIEPNATTTTHTKPKTRNIITPNIITITNNNHHTDEYDENYNLDYNTIINENTSTHRDENPHDHNDTFIPTGTNHITTIQDTNYYTPYREQLTTQPHTNINAQLDTQHTVTNTPNINNFPNETQAFDTTISKTGINTHNNTNIATNSANRRVLFHENKIPQESERPYQYTVDTDHHNNQEANHNFNITNNIPTLTRPIPPPSTPNPFINNTTHITNQNQRAHQHIIPNNNRNTNQSTIPHSNYNNDQANTQATLNTLHHNITHDQIERIIERNVARKETSDTRYKQYNKLSPASRLVLRRMCAVDIYDDEPTEPSESYLDIANSSQSVQYISFVTQLLKSKKVLGRWASNHIARFIRVKKVTGLKNFCT